MILREKFNELNNFLPRKRKSKQQIGNQVTKKLKLNNGGSEIGTPEGKSHCRGGTPCHDPEKPSTSKTAEITQLRNSNSITVPNIENTNNQEITIGTLIRMALGEMDEPEGSLSRSGVQIYNTLYGRKKWLFYGKIQLYKVSSEFFFYICCALYITFLQMTFFHIKP